MRHSFVRVIAMVAGRVVIAMVVDIGNRMTTDNSICVCGSDFFVNSWLTERQN